MFFRVQPVVVRELLKRENWQVSELLLIGVPAWVRIEIGSAGDIRADRYVDVIPNAALAS